MKHKQMFANCILLLCALIWGMTFVAQSVATDYVGAFTFQALRSVLAVVVLYPLIKIRSWTKKRNNTDIDQHINSKPKLEKKNLIIGGIVCGVVLCIASCLQQIGMKYTTAGRAGFLTSVYLIFVALFCILRGKKLGRGICIGVILAMVGIYLLSGVSGLGLSVGDILMLLCAVCFAVHIMVVDYYVKMADAISLSCMQFLSSAILSAILMFLFERPDLMNIRNAGISILYAGIMSSGIAYTLQIVGQKYAKPAVATILMSFESVFSMLGGIILLNQIPTGKEMIGFIFMFAAVLISQFGDKKTDQSITN